MDKSYEAKSVFFDIAGGGHFDFVGTLRDLQPTKTDKRWSFRGENIQIQIQYPHSTPLDRHIDFSQIWKPKKGVFLSPKNPRRQT